MGARRGQATVELVLGALLVVTVLIFGIHFAEVGYLSLKVEEAANFALWDATNHPMHNAVAGTWNGYLAAVPAAQNEAQSRYADMDGRSSTPGGGAALKQVFTEVVPVNGSLVQITCAPTLKAPGLNPSLAVGLLDLAAGVAAPALGNTGMACSATSSITGFNIPTHFLERSESGWFKSIHWNPLTIHVCSSGFASGGSCANNKFGILLDDWGLTGSPNYGPDESEACYLLDQAGCANPGYYDVVQKIFNNHPPGSAGTALAAVVGANPGVNEAKFWMSFAPSDSPYGKFVDFQSVEHRGYTKWETTAFSKPAAYSVSWTTRSTCFLGINNGQNPCP